MLEENHNLEKIIEDAKQYRWYSVPDMYMVEILDTTGRSAGFVQSIFIDKKEGKWQVGDVLKDSDGNFGLIVKDNYGNYCLMNITPNGDNTYQTDDTGIWGYSETTLPALQHSRRLADDTWHKVNAKLVIE